MSNKESIIPSVTTLSKEAGLIVFGSAVGLILSNTVGSHARKPLGFILGAVGVAAAGPEIAKLVDKVANSRKTTRGSKRTLEGIRYGAGKPVEDLNYLDEESGENMFIG